MNLAALEALEGRQLLAYSSLGYSLAELKISGQAAPVAAWGSSYQVQVTLQNTGTSTMVEPLSLVPASEVTTGPTGTIVPPFWVPSQASAGASQVQVYLAPRPRSMAGAIEIGTVTAPALGQNDVNQISVPLTLPSQPAGFRASGIYYIRLVTNQNQAVVESNYNNNMSAPLPVRFISQALPELRTTALDLPSNLQPGDTVAPTFQITNLGTANTSTQGPVQVALVASTSPDFNLGSSIVGLYTLPAGIPGQSSAPVKSSVRRHSRLYQSSLYSNNVTPGNNVETYTGAAVTLPTSPSTYYLGVVIDPYNTLNQLSLPANRLELDSHGQCLSLRTARRRGGLHTGKPGSAVPQHARRSPCRPGERRQLLSAEQASLMKSSKGRSTSYLVAEIGPALASSQSFLTGIEPIDAILDDREALFLEHDSNRVTSSI